MEYFTARKIVTSVNPPLEEMLKDLVIHVHEPHWQVVFPLVASMLQNADILFRFIKVYIDSLFFEYPQIQKVSRDIYSCFYEIKFRYNWMIFPIFLAFRQENKLVVDGLRYFLEDMSYNSDLPVTEVMNIFRRIEGIDLQYEELIAKYIQANWFLINILKTECYLSREVRQEIEETLFLPKSEIEKMKSDENQ